MYKLLFGLLFVLVVTACGVDAIQSPEGSTTTIAGSTSETISASEGGSISLGKNVRFVVPPDSLTTDTTITIEKIDGYTGSGDGISGFGSAYRLLPAGTTFDLANPAMLEMQYDPAALDMYGFDQRTLQMCYYDEEAGEHIPVACEIDTNKHTIRARIEHFTVYLPMATALAATNVAPVVALQASVPNPVRAGVPVMLRATARDLSVEGALASARMYYRNPKKTSEWTRVEMKPDTNPNSMDTYYCMLPSAFLSATDLGTGNELQYYAEVMDNLGRVVKTGTRNVDVTRSYTPGSITLNPVTQKITVGFERNFKVYAKDNTSTTSTYQFVPEIADLSADLGDVVNQRLLGVLFRAQTSGVGQLNCGFGGESGSASLSVYKGMLQSLKILGEDGKPFTAVPRVREGDTIKLDAVGYDQYGNKIYVLPVWSVSESGSVNVAGLFSAEEITGGSKTVTVRALMGSAVAEQEIVIIDTVDSVTLDTTTAEIPVGEELRLHSTVLPAEAEDTSVVWSSSDPVVATVDPTGLIKAVSPGTVSISVKTVDGNFTAVCMVTVYSIHDVVFNTLGGSEIATQKVRGGNLLTEPGIPTKADCTFDGWYKDANYAVRWEFATDTVSAPITLYARWYSTGLAYTLINGDTEYSVAKGTANTAGSVIIPEYFSGKRVTTIAPNGFNGCVDMTEIRLPSGITTLEHGAFAGCASLTSVNLPAGLKHIKESAFNSCSGLRNVSLPAGVVTLGIGTFSGCVALESVTLPSGLTSIADWTFNDCHALTGIQLPATVQTIGNSAFRNCFALSSLAWNGVRGAIGNSAFQKCTSLTAVEIPAGVTAIGESAFYECSGLNSVIIPETVQTIGNSAFNFCTGLTSLTLPASLTGIDIHAFANCTGLKRVYIDAENPPSAGSGLFVNSAALAAILVPENSVDEYKAASGWVSYADKIYSSNPWMANRPAAGAPGLGALWVKIAPNIAAKIYVLIRPVKPHRPAPTAEYVKENRNYVKFVSVGIDSDIFIDFLEEDTGYTIWFVAETEIHGLSKPVPVSMKTCFQREMVSVPGGTYVQQTADGGNFSHTITGFKLGKYEVTYELWHSVYQWAIDNGYTFARLGQAGSGADGSPMGPRSPVTLISWRDAIVWCNAYSQMEGKTPVYCSDSGYTTPIKDSRDGSYGSSVNTAAGSFDNPYVNWNADGYRLPTEGEWQYAASYKDGSSWTPYNYASGATADYSDTTATGLVAWYRDTMFANTSQVGIKAANSLGIHDMSGNVDELCWDWYAVLPTTAQSDYRGPASGSSRPRRGGSCYYSKDFLQVGYRGIYNPYSCNYYGGFRLASKQ